MADEEEGTLPTEGVANTTEAAAAETAETTGVDDLLSGPAVSVDDLMGDDIKVDRYDVETLISGGSGHLANGFVFPAVRDCIWA